MQQARTHTVIVPLASLPPSSPPPPPITVCPANCFAERIVLFYFMYSSSDCLLIVYRMHIPLFFLFILLLLLRLLFACGVPQWRRVIDSPLTSLGVCELNPYQLPPHFIIKRISRYISFFEPFPHLLSLRRYKISQVSRCMCNYIGVM